MICMIKIEKTVDQITVENVVDVIKQKNDDIEFGELLIESYECDYDENDNCILKNATIVIPVYANDYNNEIDDYSETVMFTLNLDNVVCDESEIDEKLYEILESKIDDEIFQS